MPKKSDREQLEGILTQFSGQTIREVMSRYSEGAHCRKGCKDFDDPGPEVKVGTESRFELQEMSHLERIIAESNLLPVHFLEEGAVVQRPVARVTLKESYAGLPAGSGWATGFLVSRSLFMTNNHVIPSESFARKVEMQFNYQLDYEGNAQAVDTYSPDPDNVFYTNASLDFTLVRLSPRCRWILNGALLARRYHYRLPVATPEEILAEGFGEYTPDPLGPVTPPDPSLALPRRFRDFSPLAPIGRICTQPGVPWGWLHLRDTLMYANGQHVNIIQHPSGRRKEVALQKNTLSNIYVNRIRYTTDTQPGSSGSAVFNNGWDLIAIHHAAGTWDSTNNVWVSNEGMRIDKIVADLRSHFGGTTTGDQILSELGI